MRVRVRVCVDGHELCQRLDCLFLILEEWNPHATARAEVFGDSLSKELGDLAKTTRFWLALAPRSSGVALL